MGKARCMREKPNAARSTVEAVRAGSLRRRILEYIAKEGGELRSDSGRSLQRKICDALAERPARVSQALIALEREGLLERQMDLERHRCQAIRLVPRPRAQRPQRKQNPERTPAWAHPFDPSVTDPRRRAQLETAERELYDLIRRAAAASRRVERLRWAALPTNHAAHGPNQSFVELTPVEPASPRREPGGGGARLAPVRSQSRTL